MPFSYLLASFSINHPFAKFQFAIAFDSVYAYFLTNLTLHSPLQLFLADIWAFFRWLLLSESLIIICNVLTTTSESYD